MTSTWFRSGEDLRLEEFHCNTNVVMLNVQVRLLIMTTKKISQDDLAKMMAEMQALKEEQEALKR